MNRRRRSQRRPVKRTVLIVCEGSATEPNYFDGLKREEAVMAAFHVSIQGGCGGGRKQLVESAVKLKRKKKNLDEVWCVLDVEQADSPTAAEDLEAARQLAQKNGIELCLSNPAFEVWLLAHFERTCMSFPNAAAVARKLNKHWKKAFDCDYGKADREIFNKLASRLQDAIHNAKTVHQEDHAEKTRISECNSATDLYRLVEHLLGQA